MENCIAATRESDCSEGIDRRQNHGHGGQRNAERGCCRMIVHPVRNQAAQGLEREREHVIPDSKKEIHLRCQLILPHKAENKRRAGSVHEAVRGAIYGKKGIFP
jgi:hypothetical protein